MTASYSSVKSLLSKGISRPTLYEVNIPLGFDSQAANDQLQFLCNKTSVPEATAATIAVNGHEAMGVTREQPTFIQFTSPFSINVISDRDYTVYKSIRRWFETLGINVNPNRGPAGSSQKIAYYDTFKRTITLKKLELQGGANPQQAPSEMTPFTIEFNNAFPVRMGTIDLDSAATDTAVEFQIDFAYETYTFRNGGVNGIMQDAMDFGIGLL